MIRKIEVSCPTCKKKTIWTQENPYRPFCSERCKLIDLGAWADSQHSIPGELIDPEDSEFSEDDKKPTN